MSTLREHLARVLICLVLPQILFYGCTLIGLGIGAAADAGRDPTVIDPLTLTMGALPQGTTLMVVTRDSGTVTGEYMGVRKATTAEYAALWQEAMARIPDGSSYPAPGDSITCRFGGTGGQTNHGRLKGYDPGVVVVSFDSDASERDTHVPLRALASLTVVGKPRVDVGDLISLTQEGTIPFMTSDLLLAQEGRTVAIPFSDVSYAKEEHAKTGVFIGMGIGAAVDAAILIYAAGESAKQSCSAQPTQSCSLQK